jgi:peroxiredoxin
MMRPTFILMLTLLVSLGCGPPSAPTVPTAVPTPEGPSPEEATLVKAGEVAPGFSVTTLDGEIFDLEAQRGKIVVVNFFATWCPPCREELPHLQSDVWEAFRNRPLTLICVAREEGPEVVGPFLEKSGLNLPVATDEDRAVYARYAEAWIPRTVIIGPDGAVLEHLIDYNPDEFSAAVALIDRELTALER